MQFLGEIEEAIPRSRPGFWPPGGADGVKEAPRAQRVDALTPASTRRGWLTGGLD